MLLQPGAPGLELRIKHFDANLVGWGEKDATTAFDLVQVERHEAVFCPRAEGSTGWAVYRIARDGSLGFEEVSEGERSDLALLLRLAPSAPAQGESGWPLGEEAQG